MKKGPLSESTWGRIWARAIMNPAFRDTLEKSPRDAVVEFLGDEVVPLFDPWKTTMVMHCSRAVYNALRAQLAADKASGTTRVRDLRDGLNLNTDVFALNIINMLEGNEWKLTDRSVGGRTYKIKNFVPPHPPAPLPQKDPKGILRVTEWARIYAEAVLDEDRGGPFFPLLKRDAAEAVQEFIRRAYPNPFLHNIGAPILQLPTFNQIFTDIALFAELKRPPSNPTGPTDPNLLLQALADLDAGIESDYEVTLRICLSC
jgi:hypothetical protein